MRKIHRLFIETEQEHIRHAVFGHGRKNLCWYPSAGVDFRHITMLEEEGLNDSEAGQPLIYLHTDVRLPVECDSTKQSMAKPYFVIGKQITPKMRITKVTELHPKNILREVSREVCSWDSDENIGKVFFLEVAMNTAYRNRMIQIPIPIFYYVAENLKFLIHVLIRYQLHVDTLIHIKDGGGTFGGSQFPMNFIYQAAHALKLKRIICDESPTAKILDTKSDFSLLKSELERYERNASRNLSKISYKNMSEISEREIRATWDGKLIEPGRMPPNEYKSSNGKYYNWHLRRNLKFEQNAALTAQLYFAENG